MYVLVHQDPQIENAYYHNLEISLNKELEVRKIPAIVRIKSQLTLDETIYLKEISSFAPHAVLVIRPIGGTRAQYGGMAQIIWDVSLFGSDMKERIWRATVTDTGGTGLYPMRMAKLANAIFLKLDADKLLLQAIQDPIPDKS
jgi:hypothetical protein